MFYSRAYTDLVDSECWNRKLCCLGIAVVAAFAACSRSSPPVQFATFRDSNNNFRFDAPLGWRPDPVSQRPNSPMVSVFIRGSDQINGQAVPVDVAVSVTRLARSPAHFATQEDYVRFRRSTLLQVDALFGPPDPELREPMRSLIAKNP